MAAYLTDNLQLDDKNLELVEVGNGIFKVTVDDNVVFDNKNEGVKFPEQESLLKIIKNQFF